MADRIEMSTISHELADFALGFAARPDSRIAAGMLPYVHDTLAVILAGSTAPSSRAAARTILEAGTKAEAVIVGGGDGASAWDAALVNGVAAHALELDDDHRVAVLHPGAVVLPAALAVTQAEQGSGLTLLSSSLMGYEIACRLGQVFRGSQFQHGVHPTSICGVFGAATAAAFAMGLNREQFVNALGIAGTQASGLTEWRTAGSWIKHLHPGRAAQSGVLAARLARHGYTGPASIFEGPGGFFRAFSFGESIDPEAMTRDLGNQFEALGTAIKPYPCCRFAHGAIDIAIHAHDNGISADEIDAIDLRVYRTEVLTYHAEPNSIVDAQFNLPYVVAVALLHGAVSLDDFTDRAIRNSRVLELARKVRVVEDPEFTANYPDRYRVELKIIRNTSPEIVFSSDCPNGDPQAERYKKAPERFAEDVSDKAESILTQCGFGDRVAALRAQVEQLVPSPDVRELCAVLASPPNISEARAPNALHVVGSD